MTVRAEKSTRFPIKFCRTRPALPLRRSRMDLIGRPDRSVACNRANGGMRVRGAGPPFSGIIPKRNQGRNEGGPQSLENGWRRP